MVARQREIALRELIDADQQGWPRFGSGWPVTMICKSVSGKIGHIRGPAFRTCPSTNGDCSLFGEQALRSARSSRRPSLPLQREGATLPAQERVGSTAAPEATASLAVNDAEWREARGGGEGGITTTISDGSSRPNSFDGSAWTVTPPQETEALVPAEPPPASSSATAVADSAPVSNGDTSLSSPPSSWRRRRRVAIVGRGDAPASAARELGATHRRRVAAARDHGGRGRAHFAVDDLPRFGSDRVRARRSARGRARSTRSRCCCSECPPTSSLWATRPCRPYSPCRPPSSSTRKAATSTSSRAPSVRACEQDEKPPPPPPPPRPSLLVSQSRAFSAPYLLLTHACDARDAQARLSAFGEHLRHQRKCAIAHLAEGSQIALLPPAHGGAAELAAVFLGGGEPPPSGPRAARAELARVEAPPRPIGVGGAAHVQQGVLCSCPLYRKRARATLDQAAGARHRRRRRAAHRRP